MSFKITDKKSQYIHGVSSYALAETKKSPQKAEKEILKEFVPGMERH